MSVLNRKRNDYQDVALTLARTRQAKRFREDAQSLVYFIAAPEAEAIKVGVTKQIDRRFSTLQMACPFDLVLLGVASGGHQHEARIHMLFRKERLRGEWFRDGGFLRTFIDAVLRLPESERTEYIEREPSVPENICRNEADIEARRYVRRLVEVVAERSGPWKAARIYARVAGASLSDDDDDYGDVDRDALFETEEDEAS